MAVSLGRLEVETADHVVLRYDLAGGGNRGFAALVDFILATLIFNGAFFMFTLAAAAFGFPAASPYFGIAVLLTFAVAWMYIILLEWVGNGQPVGKRMFGLRVIADDGAHAGFTAVLVRNLVRVVDFLPGFYGFGLLMVVVSSRSQRLVREFVAREATLAPDHRARVAKQLADRLRPYTRDVDPNLSDIELIRAIARSLRASGGQR